MLPRSAAILVLAALALAWGCQRSPKPVVELYMMSKCPFASHLAAELAAALPPLAESLELRVTHLGEVRDGVATSLRGEPELQGDLLQVCAGLHGTAQQAAQFLGCQADHFERIPAGWTDCATRAGLDVARLRGCTEDGEGARALKAAMAEAAAAGVTESPTLRIAGKRYEGPRNRYALAAALCEALGDGAPSRCRQLPTPPAVRVTLITDQRCKEGCDTEAFEQLLEREVPGAVLRRVDWGSAEGKQLFAQSGRRHLPVALFPADWKPLSAHLGRQVAPHLRPSADGQWLSFPVGQRHNPLAEVCDNQLDDDQDGQLDCADADCAYRLPCRAERPNQLDIHLLMGDEFGVRGVEAAYAVLKRAPFEVRLVPMGRTADRGLVATGGEAAVREGQRLVCAQAHGLSGLALLEYAVCRHQRQGDPNWQGCLPAEVNRADVQACAGGPEGLRLLTLAYRDGEQLGVRKSPQLVVNNRYKLARHAPDVIAAALCEHNPAWPGCSPPPPGGPR